MGKLFVVLLAALVVVGGAFFLAGDLGGEVVVLTTTSAGGRQHETKLWIVEDHDQLWLRAGQPGSAWLTRLELEPRVKLERAGRTREYRAVVVPKQRERINRLMAERYGWADRLIGVVRDEAATMPVRLDPVR